MKELGFGVGRAWFESQLCHLACQVALDRRLSHAQLQLPRLKSESDSPRFMAVVGTPQADVPEARGLVLTYRGGACCCHSVSSHPGVCSSYRDLPVCVLTEAVRTCVDGAYKPR